MRSGWILVAMCSAAGCEADDPRDDDSQTLATLTDLDPDPDVVEVELVASPATTEYLDGKPADVWAFRDGAKVDSVGTVPGPMLEAKLGDRVVVHFRNELPEETTIHWHGLRVPNDADGTEVAQVPVPPGGSHDYEFTLMDAGLYWYHPHMHGDVQIERGLYAPILIHGGVEPDVASDRVFVLDDVKLAASGQLDDETNTLDLMLGRQGNVVLVNGRKGGTISAAASSRARWRFVNAANGRYFNLELPGHPFRVIGWDGGLIDQPYLTDQLLVAPGERYDVLVDLDGGEHDELELRTVHYDRGHDIPDPGPIGLLTVTLGPPGESPAALPDSWGQVAPLSVEAATLRRTMVMAEDDSDPASPVFMINDEVYPDVTAIESAPGNVEVWQLDNASEMDHPFHVHGMSFQILDDDDTPIVPLGWKDTVNVPRMSQLSVAVEIGSPGDWLFHCHILEHAERGMMGQLTVIAPP
jgi:FtsP/CotA-like multicopper oxidase with cupredoxin domain